KTGNSQTYNKSSTQFSHLTEKNGTRLIQAVIGHSLNTSHLYSRNHAVSQQDDHMPQQLLQSPPPMKMRLAFGIPLLLMALLLAFEPTVLDFWVADHLYLKEGGLFIGRKSYFLQAILHDRVKQIIYTVPLIV